jgi:hypothetical protein
VRLERARQHRLSSLGAHLPKGADLPVLVYRAPPTLAKTLPRWHVVGRVHEPD